MISIICSFIVNTATILDDFSMIIIDTISAYTTISGRVTMGPVETYILMYTQSLSLVSHFIHISLYSQYQQLKVM
jgi:hypothetical protein